MFLPPSLHSTLRSGKRERECVRESVCVSACEREREERERERVRERARKRTNKRREIERHTFIYIYASTCEHQPCLIYSLTKTVSIADLNSISVKHRKSRNFRKSIKNFKQFHTHGEKKTHTFPGLCIYYIDTHTMQIFILTHRDTNPVLKFAGISG